MLVKKMAFVSIMAIVLMLMASAAFGAGLTINGTVKVESLTIGAEADDIVTMADGSELQISGGGATAFVNNSAAADNGGLAHDGNDTVVLNDATAQTIGGTATTIFDNLTFSGSAKTIGASVINDAWDAGGQDVTISADKTVTLGSGNVTTISGGAWTLTGTLDATVNTSTIEYTTIAQSHLDINHHHLTHAGGTLSIHANGLTCNGTFTNTSGDLAASSYALTADKIVWTLGTMGAPPSGAWDIGAGGVDINGGTFVATSGTFTCGGSWDMTGGTFTAGTGTVDFDGADLTIKSDSKKFYDVAISQNASLADAMALLQNGSLTVDSGKIFDLGAYDLAGTTSEATMNNDGTIEADGDQTITQINWDNNSGTTLINDSGVTTILTSFPGDFNDLDIAGNGTLTLGKDITVANDMEVLGTTTFNMADKGITLADAGTVTNNGTWTAPTTPSTFDCEGSAAFTGAVNFFNFSCDTPNATLTFDAEVTYEVDGALTLNGGAVGTRITLQSDVGGTAFTFQNDGNAAVVDFVQIQDSTVTINYIEPTNSIKLNTNTDGWIFTITSAAATAWNLTSTWDGAFVPATTDNVVIAHNPVTLDAAHTCNDLTVDSGQQLTCADQTMTVNGASDINGTIEMSIGTYDANGTFDATGGFITFSGAGYLLLGGDTITDLGTLATNNGTVNYDHAGAQTIFVDEYNSLTVSGSGDKTTATGLDVNANLAVNAGTFVLSGTANITIGGALTIASGAGWTKGDGTTTFDGANCSITDSNGTPVDLGKIAVD